ncbi:MAG TPA: sigma 54-interacting transcriptional regulator [Gammaproteobacteria bacterium]|nr:sigma 54-interacting transcriptional regulator [Gammaproteobacteria bacterium]
MDRKTRILIVDDDPSLRRLLAIRLGDAGYAVESAGDGKDALAMIAPFRPDLVLTDLRMPSMDGMALFSEIRDHHPGLPVIILTAHGTIPDAVEATRNGVSGYLTKPFDSHQLLAAVTDALRVAAGPDADADSPIDRSWRADIITRNAAMETLLRQAALAASGEAPILIQGETGTGKQLLARAIHGAGPRRTRPFVHVDAAVIPETLLEAEFFGYDMGAVGGQRRIREGRFSAAHGGTLFIDEIDALPPVFQAKLLRALKERQVWPLAANDALPADVRLISATRRDPARAVEQRRFSQDLYYCINVVSLALPPLVERREDIPLLAAHFLKAAAGRAGKTVTGFSPQAMELLIGASWPGNVRELQNVIERAVALADTPLIPDSSIRRALHGKSGALTSLADARDQFERDYLVQLLQITEGNVSQAARIAQRNRTEFYKLLHRHRLDPVNFRSETAG